MDDSEALAKHDKEDEGDTVDDSEALVKHDKEDEGDTVDDSEVSAGCGHLPLGPAGHHVYLSSIATVIIHPPFIAG